MVFLCAVYIVGEGGGGAWNPQPLRRLQRVISATASDRLIQTSSRRRQVLKCATLVGYILGRCLFINACVYVSVCVRVCDVKMYTLLPLSAAAHHFRISFSLYKSSHPSFPFPLPPQPRLLIITFLFLRSSSSHPSFPFPLPPQPRLLIITSRPVNDNKAEILCIWMRCEYKFLLLLNFVD